MRKWNALFSRTGSEIAEISSALGRWPDKIITNREDLSNISDQIKSQTIIQIPNKPTVEDYQNILDKDALVTLNGFLRIVPAEVCGLYEIYNGHPGLIHPSFYPELKGKDPQKRAWSNKYELVGCVIHQATAELDAGEIVQYKAISNNFTSEEDLIQGLHDVSVSLWISFLKEKLV
ncbi:MAG: formyltransferase family protein [Nitrosotalea sp.]